MHIINRHTCSLVLLAACLMSSVARGAFSFTTGDPNAGGIGYYGYISMGAGDFGGFSTHVGAWSWEDEGIFTPPEEPVGWTHTSRWIALDLTAPVEFTIDVIRDAMVPYTGAGNESGFADTDFMYPSLTLWQGWDNDLMPEAQALLLGYDPMTANDHHTYINHGNVDWAEDLTYLAHIGNNTQESASGTYNLAAGQYTLVFGSNAPSATNPPRQGFGVTFAAPEPSRALLLACGCAVVVLRRRRR